MIAPLRRLGWFALASLVLYPLAGLGATALIGPRLGGWLTQPAWAWAIAFALLECTVVAVAAPFWAAGREGLKGAVARLVLFQLGSTVIAVGSVFMSGGGSVAAALQAQCVVFCFGVLLIAITCLADEGNRWRTQLAAALLGLLMLGTTFYCSPFVEMTRSQVWRGAAVTGSLYVNPVVVLAGSVYNYDFLRGRPARMYEYCVIGPYYPFRYPRWWAASLIYVAAAAVLGAVRYGRG
jgi:hypothetical protein